MTAKIARGFVDNLALTLVTQLLPKAPEEEERG
jgi:hypothetical protein